MSLFMQALLVAVFVTVAFIDSHTTQTHIFRPVVVGPVAVSYTHLTLPTKRIV